MPRPTKRATSNMMNLRPCPRCGDPMAPTYECKQHYDSSQSEPLMVSTNPHHMQNDDIFHRDLTFYHTKNEWLTSPNDLDPITITVMYSTRGRRGYVCKDCGRSDQDPFECCDIVEWYDGENFQVHIKGFLDFNPEEMKFMAKEPRKFHAQFLEFLEDAICRDFQTMAQQFIGLKRELRFALSPNG
jgi:hypothetical protein